MILLADSGSTKCDWVLVNEDYEIQKEFKTIGFNPYFTKGTFIENILKRDPQFSEIRKNIAAIYFYGAGCSNDYFNRIIEDAFANVFPNAVIQVDHDLKASAYACYDGKPAICGILGTGANSCFFDGETLTSGHPSMGFILGDEGSGNYYGKRLLRKYFYKLLPEDLDRDFKIEHDVQHLTLSKNVYESDYANVYLASFMRFISDRKSHPFFKNMLEKGFRKFFRYHIMCFDDYEKYPVHFVGSIAFHFSDILHEVAKEYNITIGNIVQKPLHAVVNYHKKYLSPIKQYKL